ncbi:hypothetical protein PILCRDRAFT_85476 [Piloderma croceum F 1598]|uniref:Uncharacterized protein n=1 Tax=Piloderma croceum (strain F 1598) TaxID=765440 RepID=A0A0C3GC42_PILCF|nr:hypothetical protein PILCRDRAFT_85476 [Piloderma croceum F 1598]
MSTDQDRLWEGDRREGGSCSPTLNPASVLYLEWMATSRTGSKTARQDLPHKDKMNAKAFELVREPKKWDRAFPARYSPHEQVNWGWDQIHVSATTVRRGCGTYFESREVLVLAYDRQAIQKLCRSLQEFAVTVFHEASSRGDGIIPCGLAKPISDTVYIPWLIRSDRRSPLRYLARRVENALST